MIRNLKALGLALVAVLALGAITASSALAAFEAEGTPVRVTRSANNTQEFTYNEGVVTKCTTVGGSGEQAISPSEDFRFNPTLSGCTFPAFGATAEVSMNGCGYTFTSAMGSTSMSTHIACPEGQSIDITVKTFGSTLCDLHIAPQTPGGTIAASNVGSGTTREFKISLNVNGISGTRTGSSLCGPATSTTGTYSGEVNLTGETTGPAPAHVGIFMD